MLPFQLPIEIKKPPVQIRYGQKILLTGSCFTEHIGNVLGELKFPVMQNPHGILFDPHSVCKSLVSYAKNRQYKKEELFLLNEVWHSWDHHSRFSGMNPQKVIEKINASQQQAHLFLQSADWIIIALGSSFSYRLTDLASLPGSSPSPFLEKGQGGEVANCHRAPARWFNKSLMEIEEISKLLNNCHEQLMAFNPRLQFIYTVSPVRHIRDGVVENNRSKARLLEAVHRHVNSHDNIFYFPAYELVIDVLRDYRFYDADLVHPNYMATQYVIEKFSEIFINEESGKLMEEIKKLVIARKHRAFQPGTSAHREFLLSHFNKTVLLKEKYQFLDLEKELQYFKKGQEDTL